MPPVDLDHEVSKFALFVHIAGKLTVRESSLKRLSGKEGRHAPALVLHFSQQK